MKLILVKMFNDVRNNDDDDDDDVCNNDDDDGLQGMAECPSEALHWSQRGLETPREAQPGPGVSGTRGRSQFYVTLGVGCTCCLGSEFESQEILTEIPKQIYILFGCVLPSLRQ